MVIDIGQNRINVHSGGVSGNTNRRETPTGYGRTVLPTRAVENNIPAPETLNTMIRSAISALRSGALWDRGTILNIVV
jgi:hypothetical protein